MEDNLLNTDKEGEKVIDIPHHLRPHFLGNLRAGLREPYRPLDPSFGAYIQISGRELESIAVVKAPHHHAGAGGRAGDLRGDIHRTGQRTD